MLAPYLEIGDRKMNKSINPETMTMTDTINVFMYVEQVKTHIKAHCKGLRKLDGKTIIHDGYEKNKTPNDVMIELLQGILKLHKNKPEMIQIVNGDFTKDENGMLCVPFSNEKTSEEIGDRK